MVGMGKASTFELTGFRIIHLHYLTAHPKYFGVSEASYSAYIADYTISSSLNRAT
jgi:hypothetical protein